MFKFAPLETIASFNNRFGWRGNMLSNFSSCSSLVMRCDACIAVSFSRIEIIV